MTQYERPSISLWDGGTSTFDSSGDGSTTMIMKDLEDGSSDLVAMVSDVGLVPLFIAAPEMLATCKYLLQVAEVHSLPDDVVNAIALVKMAIHDVEVGA